MKKILLAAACSVAAATLVFACGKEEEKKKEKKKETVTTTSSVAPDFLLTATRETAPVIAPGSLAIGLNLGPSEQLGSVYYSIFNMLRSWNPDTDNRVVDMGNIYHVLDVAGDQYGKVSGYTPEACKTSTCVKCKPAFDAALKEQCIGKDGPVSSTACDPLVATFTSSCPGSTCEPCYEQWWMAASSSAGLCTPFSAAKVVASPYSFGMNETYSCAVSSGQMGEEYPYSVAASEAGANKEIKKLLTGFVWAGSGTEGEFNVIQGNYNESTKDLVLHFAQLVDHGQSNFVRRIEILGNVSAHTFTLRSLNGPKQGASGSWVSIVGKGISKGSGNYFLLKVKSDSTGWTDAKYLCLSADATGDTFVSLATSKPTGDTTVATECAAYQQEVDALTFFAYPTDVPQTLTDFTGKGGSSVLLDF